MCVSKPANNVLLYCLKSKSSTPEKENKLAASELVWIYRHDTTRNEKKQNKEIRTDQQMSQQGLKYKFITILLKDACLGFSVRQYNLGK